MGSSSRLPFPNMFTVIAVPNQLYCSPNHDSTYTSFDMSDISLHCSEGWGSTVGVLMDIVCAQQLLLNTYHKSLAEQKREARSHRARTSRRLCFRCVFAQPLENGASRPLVTIGSNLQRLSSFHIIIVIIVTIIIVIIIIIIVPEASEARFVRGSSRPCWPRPPCSGPGRADGSELGEEGGMYGRSLCRDLAFCLPSLWSIVLFLRG